MMKSLGIKVKGRANGLQTFCFGSFRDREEKNLGGAACRLLANDI
jgi:hypothetical protein